MNENLISKKELLARYGISYGALYRWKRRGLIPEEWFLKKSTVTGQETFFREEQICPRVEQILAARDEASLIALERQLGHEEEDSRRLAIVTDFEEKLFRISELRSIRILDGGNEIDVTAQILQEIEKGGNKNEN